MLQISYGILVMAYYLWHKQRLRSIIEACTPAGILPGLETLALLLQNLALSHPGTETAEEVS